MTQRDDPAAPKDHGLEDAEGGFVIPVSVLLLWVIAFPVMWVRYRIRGGIRRVFADEFRRKYPNGEILEMKIRRTARRCVRRAEIVDLKGDRHVLAYNRADEVMSWE